MEKREKERKIGIHIFFMQKLTVSDYNDPAQYQFRSHFHFHLIRVLFFLINSVRVHQQPYSFLLLRLFPCEISLLKEKMTHN